MDGDSGKGQKGMGACCERSMSPTSICEYYISSDSLSNLSAIWKDCAISRHTKMKLKTIVFPIFLNGTEIWDY